MFKDGSYTSLNTALSGHYCLKVYGMYVYFIRAGNSGAIKIGMAVNIERRINTLQAGNAFKLQVLALIPCDCREEALHLEQRIHKFFAKQRIRGEWFQGNIDFRKFRGAIDY